jgi:hypothetical protein
LAYAGIQNKEYLWSSESNRKRREAKDMAKLVGVFSKNRFRVPTLLGILFLVVGVSLLGYSVSVIQDYGQLSSSADLTLEQMWHYDGSLSWWRNAYFTLFLPLTSVFVTLGGVVLVTQPLMSKLHHKSVP